MAKVTCALCRKDYQYGDDHVCGKCEDCTVSVTKGNMMRITKESGIEKTDWEHIAFKYCPQCGNKL